MVDWLHKIGPVGAVVVVFTWICWPYITGSATAVESRAASKTGGLPKVVLSPKIKTPVERDPFQVISALLQESDSGESAPGESANAASGEADPQAPSSLALTGIYLRGDRSMAILGGAIYRPGQAVGQSGGAPWVVKQILADRVVLGRGAETKVITYSDRTAQQAADDGGAGSSRDAGKGSGSQGSASSGATPSVLTLSDLIETIERAQAPGPKP